MISLRIFFYKVIAWVLLVTERFWSAFWPVVSWVFFFIGLTLLNVYGVVWLLFFIAGFVFLWRRFCGRFEWPSSRDVMRRIETDSAVEHRPLSGKREILVNPYSDGARAMWGHNKRVLRAYLAALRMPRVHLVRSKDIFGFGFAAFLVFGFGVLAAGDQWQERLTHGFMPVSFTIPGAVQNAQITITPPDYTNLQALHLGMEDRDAILKIPQGSSVKALIQGGIGTPSLRIQDQTFKMSREGEERIYTTEGDIPDFIPAEDGEDYAPLELRQWLRGRVRWGYRSVVDAPPTIELAESEDISVSEDALVRLGLRVQDDYAVESLEIMMQLDPVVEQAPVGENAIDVRSVMSPPNVAYDVFPVLDYRAHSWAGLPVVLHVTALDHLGQTAVLEPVSVVLPEKDFRHPVTKRLIVMRKELSWTPTMETKAMASELEEILFRPSSFHDDLTVFLALRSAASRLYWNDPSVENSKTVIALLWDIALAIEDGNLSVALRNLRDAQNALERGMRNSEMSDREIGALMHAMRQAMDDYMSEMQREIQKMMENGEELPIIPPEMMAQTMNPDVMQSFLDQLEQEMRDGNKGKVREMLSQLQNMMDGMSGQMAEMPADMQMMEDGVNELQQLIERQQSLLDQTLGQIGSINGTTEPVEQDFGEPLPSEFTVLLELDLENMPPQPTLPREHDTPPEVVIDTSANKVEQEALRLILGQLMLDAAEVLEDIPENMGLAEQEMRGSALQLGLNAPEMSVPHQEEAIKQLKEAQKNLNKQFMEKMKQMSGMKMSRGGMRLPFGLRGQKMDPLGRPFGGEDQKGGMFPGSDVKVPNDAERTRALEVLRELRRREAQRDRPDVELDYYRRLLKQF